MRSRVALIVGLAVLLVTTAIASAGLRIRDVQSNKTDKRIELAITTRQLPEENGAIPAELKCGNAELSTPNKIEALSCALMNNTNKYISATTVAISIAVEKEGKVSLDTSFQTIETFVHPDLRAERAGSNLIPPGGEHSIQDLPTSYDDALIKGVTMWIDHVEFEDNTALGPDKAGSRIIAGIREGAAKYKSWLVRKYERSGRSINAIIPLLESQLISEEELGIENGDQRQGAIFYQNFARRTYKIKGPERLTKYLK